MHSEVGKFFISAFVILLFAVETESLEYNVTAVVPQPVRFECDLQKGLSILLRKDNITLVKIENSSITKINSNFKATLFGNVTVLVELKTSQLTDEGKYSCITFNKTTEIVGNIYMLKISTKPSIKVNATSEEIFEGEAIRIDCHASGIPTPTIEWKFDKRLITKLPRLEIKNAKQNESGLYTCVARNKNGDVSEVAKMVVKDKYPSLPLLTLENRTENSLELHGEKPKYVGRGNVIKYFQLKCNAIGFVATINESNTFKQVISSLEPSRAYEFELIACNAFVCSKSLVKNFTTAEPGKPMQPVNLKVMSKGSYDVEIGWMHGGHYKEVFYSNITCIEEKSKQRTLKIDGQNNTHKIKNLKPFTNYTFTVITCVQVTKNLVLCSDPSKKLLVTTDIAAPSAPTIMRPKNTFADEISIVVEWLPSEFPNGPVVAYKVLFRVKGDSRWNPELVEKKSIPGHRSLRSYDRHELRHLKQMTEHEIMVSAFNKAGSNNSSIEVIKTDAAPPQKPLNITLIKATPSSLFIGWSPPQNLPPSIRVCYHVDAKTLIDDVKYSSPVCNRSVNQMEIKSLKMNTTYVVSVYASIKRPRDQKDLNGESIEKVFNTGFPEKPTEKKTPKKESSSASLILVTVLSIFIIFAVAGFAIFYCKRQKIFTLKNQSIFYIEESGNRPLASRLSMRSAERKPAAITVEDFPDHVARLHADSDYLFSEEFHSLANRPDFTWENSTLRLNQVKNRYQDIVAYDHSRVRLMSIDGVPASNYINANFIDGFQKKPAYIATQAPLNHTIEDFWRMVWEQDVRLIVMLTNLTERGKRKCDQYWPHHGDICYGVITVRTIEEHRYAHYVHRVFNICWNDIPSGKAYGYDEDQWKIVRQFHFTDWPDFGVPRERTTMLSFVQMVRRYMQENEGPTIVHCSAGVGRSGTFIVIEAQIERINRKQNVNVYGYLKNIRSQRNYLVQQEVQYIFLHDALVDYIKCGLTAIPVGELEETLEQDYFTINPDTGLTVIDEEWQIINEFNINEYEMLCGKRPCNQQKNRDSFIIPIDSSRVRLTMKGATEGTDYINANYIDGYLRKNSFIVTQMPLHDTVEDFWRMIWENFSYIIVSLLTDEEHNMEDVLSYLPRSDCNPINFGSFEIHCISTQDESNFRLRELEIVGRVDWGESEKRKVYHYQYLKWPESKMPVADHVFEMIDSVKERKASLNANTENTPIVLHCSCGVGRSGIFCALWNIKEQMDDIEETVDVFSIVRLMRRQRPLIIPNKASYEYLYTAAQRYKELMPMYPSKELKPKEELTFAMEFSDEVKKLIENMEEDSDDSEI